LLRLEILPKIIALMVTRRAARSVKISFDFNYRINFNYFNIILT
jgi:hypothetical protein